jgi:hypothetical protein
MSFYYMRDNHSFVPLSSDPDQIKLCLEAEFAKGWTCGTVFSKKYTMPPVHAHGESTRNAFINEAISKIQEALSQC